MHEGCYAVIDSDDGERVARIARFMPGDLVLVEGARITTPALARAIAEAMVALADELDARSDDNPRPRGSRRLVPRTCTTASTGPAAPRRSATPTTSSETTTATRVTPTRRRTR
jgi:hypothetical protein